MNVSELTSFEEQCTGCMACKNACQNEAICISTNEEGFYVPKILQDKCNGCGKCMTVCENFHSNHQLSKPKQIYACQSKNEKFLKNATSGAFFPELCAYVIKKGGVAFGAMYDEQMKVVHGAITQIEEITKLCGSKYSESFMGDIYSKVVACLKEGKEVVFSGTPCQIAGLLSYVNEKEVSSEKLITVDVICYGIPSSMIFEKTVKHYVDLCGVPMKDYRFRDKEYFGWSHTTRIRFADGKERMYMSSQMDLYYRLWSKTELCLRKVCYNCRFISQNRISDFTIGNYWGIEEIDQNHVFQYEKGVSLVMVNSEKGNTVMENLGDSLRKIKGDWDSVLKYQHGLKARKKPSVNREKFYAELKESSILMIADKYAPLSKVKRTFLKMPIWLQNLIYFPIKLKKIRSGVRK